MFDVRYDYVFEYNMITTVRVYLHFCSDASSTRKVSHLVPVQVSTGSVDDHPQPLNAFKAICTVFGVGQGGARMPVPGLPRGNLVAGGCRQGGRERARVSEQTRTARCAQRGRPGLPPGTGLSTQKSFCVQAQQCLFAVPSP